jgi:ArsR family transcriptional regulator, arsenate/arsenite/antimonite-responsive transcriptional repressor
LNKVFDALASDARRKILAHLAQDELSAGEIAARFSMSKPAISKHLQILENAGLVTSDKRGQFVWYSLAREELTLAIARFMQTVAPVEVPRAARPRPVASKQPSPPTRDFANRVP